MNRPIDVPLVGDVRDILPQLNEALASVQRTAPAELSGWHKAHKAEKQAQFDAVPETSSPIHHGRLAIEASDALPRDSVIVRDGGASGMFFSQMMQFLPTDAMWNSNYGAVGPGLPNAIGAKIGVGKSRPVVLLSGDSSFQFHISEIETAVREDLPIVCIVAVDNAWGIECASYKAAFGPDTAMPGAQWDKGVRLDKTAESFGAHGEYVEKVEDIRPAVERAFASGKCAVIHVAIDGTVNHDMPNLPGLGEFRTWYGEPGDNLGFAGAAPAKDDSETSDQGSGY